jgi:hypothetical protein
MEEFITPDIIATEVVMTLAGFEGTVVLTEGPTDQVFYGGILQKDRFRALYAKNKDYALEVLDIIVNQEAISSKKKSRVMAFVDADFDRPLQIGVPINCFRTDFHDLEVMIIWSNAFDRWLEAYCSIEKLKRFGGSDKVREKILDVCGYIGAARFFSKKNDLGISFDKINYEGYFNKKTLCANRDVFCQGLYNINKNRINGMSIKDLKNKIEEELSKFVYDKRDLIQGHDVMNVLGIMLRYVLASHDAKICAEEVISPALFLAYRPEEWAVSDMAQQVFNYLSAGS